jgi:hypothetical protein
MTPTQVCQQLFYVFTLRAIIQLNPAALAVAAQFRCDAAMLQHSLTHRTLDIVGQSAIKVPLRTDQAVENRDALAKYHRHAQFALFG